MSTQLFSLETNSTLRSTHDMKKTEKKQMKSEQESVRDVIKKLSKSEQQDIKQTIQKRNNMKSMTQALRHIYQWVDNSLEEHVITYLSDQWVQYLLVTLHDRVQRNIIVISEYHELWMGRMEKWSQYKKMRWAFLNSNQFCNQKVRVLELYQLRQTKLFFIAPSLFINQDYHQFQCDLLIIADAHLYVQNLPILKLMIQKCMPRRVLALHSTPFSESYRELGLKRLENPNQWNKTCICLKTNQQDKIKSMINYFKKGEFKRVLVLVNNHHEAKEVSSFLKKQAIFFVNLTEMTVGEQNQHSQNQQLLKGFKKEDYLINLIWKSQKAQITISKHFDILRVGRYDCVIFCSFVDVPRFLEQVPDIPNRLILLVEDEYHTIRNKLTAESLQRENLMRIVMHIMERPRLRNLQGSKRYFSASLEDKISYSYNCHQQNEEKVICVNHFLKKEEISFKMFEKIMEILQKNRIIETLCKLVYQIEIPKQSIALLKKKFPSLENCKGRVNLLNLSTSLSKTTQTILYEFRNSKIQYKVLEEAIQIRVLQDFQNVDWETLETTVNENIQSSVKKLDKSFLIYKQCSYGSIELTKREKQLKRKNALLNFYQNTQDGFARIFSGIHKISFLSSQLQEELKCIPDFQEFEEHELILILQGIKRPNKIKFKECAVFGRYKKVSYQQLLQAIKKLRNNKKIKKNYQ